MANIEDGKYYWAQFNRFEIRMPAEAINDLSGGGQKDEMAEYWAKKVIHHVEGSSDWNERNGAIIFHRATKEAINEELRDYGAWDDYEREDHAMNIQRLIWIAANDIAEDEEPDSSEPVA